MSQPKYHAFDVEHLAGDVVIGIEKIQLMEKDIRALHELHYNETETLYLEIPFDPDYQRYIASEQAGQFVVFTVRKRGCMVGYLQYYVFRDMHSQKAYTAREDALFLRKSVRGKNIAPALLRYAEHCLKQLGCRYVGMSSKAPTGGPDIGAFLERKGYRPVALYYVKDLGVADAQATRTKTS